MINYIKLPAYFDTLLPVFKIIFPLWAVPSPSPHKNRTAWITSTLFCLFFSLLKILVRPLPSPALAAALHAPARSPEAVPHGQITRAICKLRHSVENQPHSQCVQRGMHQRQPQGVPFALCGRMARQRDVKRVYRQPKRHREHHARFGRHKAHARIRHAENSTAQTKRFPSIHRSIQHCLPFFP